MKTDVIIPLLCALLTTSVSANPVKSVTIQLANDQSGANANVKIPADGKERSVEALWGHTSVAQHGVVYATSAQLTAFQQDTVCTISKEPHLDAMLNSRQTWVSLKHGSLVNLKGAFVECQDT